MNAIVSGPDVADPELVGLIYEAAVSPQVWPMVLEKICRVAGCTQASLTAHHPAEADITFFYSHGIDDQYIGSFASRFALISPNATKCFFNDLGVAQCSELFDDLNAFQNSVFYKEWCVPQGIARQCILMLVRNEKKCGALIVSLASSDDAKAQQTLAKLNLYCDHLVRAVRIHNTLIEQEKATAAAKGAMDRIDAPVLMLDAAGNVVGRNKKALLNPCLASGPTGREVLSRVYGLTKTEAFLDAVDRDRGPQKWIEHYITPLQSSITPHVVTYIQVPVDQDEARGFDFGHDTSSIIIIHDTSAQKPVRPEVFVKLFSLTPSEAQVMTLLAQGMTVADIASIQGVASTTIRSHISAAMQKTGTRRQVDLVRVAVNSMLPMAFAQAQL